MLQEFNNKKPKDRDEFSEEEFEKALADMLKFPDQEEKELLSLEELDRFAQASMEEFERTKLPEMLKLLEEMDEEEIARRRRELEEQERSSNSWAEQMVRKEEARKRQRKLRTEQETREEPKPETAEIRSEITESAPVQDACISSETQKESPNAIAVESEPEEKNKAKKAAKASGKFRSGHRRLLTEIASAAAIVAIVLVLGANHSIVKGGYAPGVSQDTATGGYLDAGDAKRTQTDSANKKMREAAESRELPVIELDKYEKAATYEAAGAGGEVLFGFLLHVMDSTVHIQYLYLANSASLTTPSDMEQVEELELNGKKASIYQLKTEGAEETQYFTYLTVDAYMISITANMEYEYFCDFLKDLSIQ